MRCAAEQKFCGKLDPAAIVAGDATFARFRLVRSVAWRARGDTHDSGAARCDAMCCNTNLSACCGAQTHLADGGSIVGITFSHIIGARSAHCVHTHSHCSKLSRLALPATHRNS
jgi:hypothetical protein